ncbi:hypothetical protein [Flammeovirga kamogawensis]|uniref:Uncharacterized protein n=1 Tax=Flammeovirga kamogawensis TaxID=373891 RepID=A0ABX8GXI4_9BACT|nr:hypothetical protein [Flammeovirga kamogawensis]MBB6462897.1 hypothetical protein [Flammeovirga kamogawensis]QWG08323.1 hypothetical protein KM029_05140 [Flammeovirga kamogawensis]
MKALIKILALIFLIGLFSMLNAMQSGEEGTVTVKNNNSGISITPIVNSK